MSHRIPANPSRILVGLISPIGDTLLATPALAALRRAFPKAEIAALVAPSNAGILSGNPDVDRLIFAPAQGAEPEWRRYLAALRALRRERFDLIINFSGASGLTTRFAHPFTPRMFLDLPRWWFLAGGDATLRERRAVDQYLRTLAPLVAAPPTDPEARVPRIHLTAQDRAQARELLARGRHRSRESADRDAPGRRRLQWTQALGAGTLRGSGERAGRAPRRACALHRRGGRHRALDRGGGRW